MQVLRYCLVYCQLKMQQVLGLARHQKCLAAELPQTHLKSLQGILVFNNASLMLLDVGNFFTLITACVVCACMILVCCAL